MANCEYQSNVSNTQITIYSSPVSLAFWAAMACAAEEAPGTVEDCRNEICRLVAVTAAAPLLMTGLFGGIGGATRDTDELKVDFFTGGCGGF
jgi:hypothetical protein